MIGPDGVISDGRVARCSSSSAAVGSALWCRPPGPAARVDGMTDGPDPMQGLDDDLYRRLFDRRTIVLGEPLEDRNSNRLCQALLLLSAEDPKADIRLLINSPGGSVPGMLAIRDCMRAIPNDVCTINLGMAYSAGQFLLSSGTKGKRYAMPHAKVLLHQGSAGIGGTAMDIAIQADDLRRTRDTVLALHRGGHRPADRPDRGGLPARPLVHRRGGAGLRLRRRRRHLRRRRAADRAPPGRAGEPAMSGYTIPYVTTRTPPGERTVDVYSRLLADRIVYLGHRHRRRRGQRGDRPAAAPRERQPRRADRRCTSTRSAGRSRRRWPSTTPCSSSAPRVETTCVGQAVASAAVLLAGGAAGHPGDPPARAGGHPRARRPGPRRHPRPHHRGGRRRAGARPCRSASSPGTPGGRRSRSAATPSGSSSSPPRPPWTTASSTPCSASRGG